MKQNVRTVYCTIYGGKLLDNYDPAQAKCIRKLPTSCGGTMADSRDTPDVPGKLDPCRVSVRNAIRRLDRK